MKPRIIDGRCGASLTVASGETREILRVQLRHEDGSEPDPVVWRLALRAEADPPTAASTPSATAVLDWGAGGTMLSAQVDVSPAGLIVGLHGTMVRVAGQGRVVALPPPPTRVTAMVGIGGHTPPQGATYTEEIKTCAAGGSNGPYLLPAFARSVRLLRALPELVGYRLRWSRVGSTEVAALYCPPGAEAAEFPVVHACDGLIVECVSPSGTSLDGALVWSLAL